MTVDPFLYPNLPYDTQKDLTPVASLAIVRVLPAGPPVGAREDVRRVRRLRAANPGKLSYGSAGSGSSPHLAGEMFTRAAGSRPRTFRTRVRRPRSTICSAGRCNSCSTRARPAARRHRQARRARVASAKRASKYPDVATLEELGMRVDADTTFGVYAPAGVNPAIVERMNREINKTLEFAGARRQHGAAGRRSRAADDPGIREPAGGRSRALRRVHQGGGHQGRLNKSKVHGAKVVPSPSISQSTSTASRREAEPTRLKPLASSRLSIAQESPPS